MTNYYFLTTLLPDLSFDEKPEISFLELMDLFSINLRKEDFEQFIVIQRYIDLYNMRNAWRGSDFDKRGLFAKETFEASEKTLTGLPEYVLDFFQRFSKSFEKAKEFPSLLGSYFQEEEGSAKGFLKKYLRFEREWRLVMTYLRAKKLNRDVKAELKFEDPSDPFVDEILCQKEVPLGYEELEKIYEIHNQEPLELLKETLEFRFRKIETLKGDNPFSFDQLLGYAVQLLLVERWQEAVKESDEKLVDEIIKAAK